MTQSDRTRSGVALVLAPVLFAVSSFFWTPAGTYGVAGGTILVFGSIFWIVAFVALFDELKATAPRYAAWGWLVAVYGAVCGGAGFAFQGIFTALHDVTHEADLRAIGAHPLTANAIFWIGGPAFPLTLLVLGIVLVRTRTTPLWVGALLSLGGALFPIARIPRLALVAHGVDLLMLIPAAFMGWNLLRGRSIGGRG